MRNHLLLSLFLTFLGASSFGGVWINSPANGATVGGSVNFVANSNTSCGGGIGAMGIYAAPYQLSYVGSGSNLNHSVQLNNGNYNVVVVAWDRCGGASAAAVKINVNNGGGGGGGNGKSFTNLQNSGGWTGAGQGPPNFIDCSPCSKVAWSSEQGIQSPSVSGRAAKYDIWGSGPYWDVLFNNHLIGDGSSQGMLDHDHVIVPTLHDFTYDVYFFGSNLRVAQALEFDFNQFFDGMGFIWGHECRIAGGNEWDIWDNINQHWVPTGIACHPINNAWNHLTLHVQRTSDNHLFYQSITLNGVTNYPNTYYRPGPAPGWYGITVNYQMDGNNKQDPYSIYLDQLTYSYQ